MDDFDRALAQAQRWLDRDGVVGVGEGEENGERAIVVWLLPDADVGLPERLDGVAVTVRHTGELRAL